VLGDTLLVKAYKRPLAFLKLLNQPQIQHAGHFFLCGEFFNGLLVFLHFIQIAVQPENKPLLLGDRRCVCHYKFEVLKTELALHNHVYLLEQVFHSMVLLDQFRASKRLAQLLSGDKAAVFLVQFFKPFHKIVIDLFLVRISLLLQVTLVVVENGRKEQILEQIEPNKYERREKEPRPPVVRIVGQSYIWVIRQRKHDKDVYDGRGQRDKICLLVRVEYKAKVCVKNDNCTDHQEYGHGFPEHSRDLTKCDAYLPDKDEKEDYAHGSCDNCRFPDARHAQNQVHECEE